MSEASLSIIQNAVIALRAGGVIAYPTEYCFGLGCDPNNPSAVERLLHIKRRNRDQGVILVASSVEQVERYVDLDKSPIKQDVLSSWPGPNTWLLPAKLHVSEWLRGKHQSVAMRVSAHSACRELCEEFGDAIVSTSANRHGCAALITAQAVEAELGDELDFVVKQNVGDATQPSNIRDGMTGQQVR